MLLNTKDIKIDISDFPVKNMADIFLGKLAKEQKVPIFVVEHKAGWLTYLNPQSTIWRSHTKEFDQYQDQVLNSFLKQFKIYLEFSFGFSIFTSKLIGYEYKETTQTDQER